MEIRIAELLGVEPDSEQALVDYGYRAAWKVTARNGTFLLKADERDGFVEREVNAQRHAAAHGVPTAAPVTFFAGSPPAMSCPWRAGGALHGIRHRRAWMEAGRVLRTMHEVPVLAQRGQPWADFIADWFAAELTWMVAHGAISRRDQRNVLSACERLRPILRATPLAWIHGDCQAAHFIVSDSPGPGSGPEIAAVIDWGDAQHGAPEMDFAVLTLFDDGVLPWLLEGYGASPELRRRLAETLPLYQAVRAAGSLRWLESHGYPGHTWPIERVCALANGAPPN